MRVSIVTLCVVLCALILIVPVSAVTVGTIINRGSTVFIGEKGLDITNVMNANGDVRQRLGYLEPGSSTLDNSHLTNSISVSNENAKNFDVLSMKAGRWYAFTDGDTRAPAPAFEVADPTLTLIIRERGISVNNKIVTKDSILEFELLTNLNQVIYNRYNKNSTTGGIPTAINKLTDGFVNIDIQTPEGATYSSVYGSGTMGVLSTQNIFITGSTFTWSDWDLGANDTSGRRIYQAGSYSVSAKSTLNGMDINYDIVGKTHTLQVPVTIGFTNVILTTNHESVIRNKPFSITITGRPNSYYNLWVKDTNKMTDTNEQPPTISEFQSGVAVGSNITGNYIYQNSGNKTIAQNTANSKCYAAVSTSTSGTATVQFETSPNTKSQKYVIRVEEYVSGQYNYDEITIVVGGGTISIVSQGYQNYYIGEVIKFSGTNSESYETFLFMIGPNLPANGAQMKNPRVAVIDEKRETFHIEPVENGDWSWDFATTSLALDAGSYTVYAVSEPRDRLHLGGVSYATTSISLKKPYISASISQPVVASGDPLHIKGVAEGNPNGVVIWIMGKNYMTSEITSTDSGSLFDYEVERGTTDTMSNGQYFVVIQHPMQNGQFDIVLKDNYIVNMQMNINENKTGTKIFQISGSGSLQGSDAAQALIKALDDQNIDDSYTRLGFIIDNPIISINKIGDKKIGDKFTITGKTNLAVDDGVQIEIYSSSFRPTEKSSSGEFSGATGTVKVIKNDAGDGMNRIEFEVDASTFREDEYIVTASGVEIEVVGTTLFNVIGQSLVQTNTTMSTMVTMQTPIPTPIPTIAAPTPTTTKQSPGFGAVFAVIGICIIGFIIARRE